MHFQNIFVSVSVINLLMAGVLIFLERKNIATTWAWLMVLLFLPGIGFVLYLILGQNLSKRRIYKIKEEEFSLLHSWVLEQTELIEKDGLTFNDPSMPYYQNMIYMNLMNDHALFTQNNQVKIYTEGTKKFTELLRCIEEAKHHIHLMYYIFRDDSLGQQVTQALTRKAKEGVEVRVLYDAIGSSRLSRQFFTPLQAAGGQVAAFFPSKIPYLNIRLNFRNHRKIVVIDGKIGFLGGFNVGDEYLGKNKYFGHWRDTHLKIEGSALVTMQTRFFLDWNLANSNRLSPTPDYFPIMEHQGTVGMQIVSSGPNSDRQQIRNSYLKMIYSARQTIYLQTPYFIPDDSFLTALRTAVLSGVDVKIMFPYKADHRLVYWASSTYLGYLLNNGVKCYLYQKGFLHAKTMVVDNKIATVGTANADIRSFKLNFETNAFIYDSSTAEELAEIFMNDLTHCQELTLEAYQKRSLLTRFFESLARLLSPIF
ncbi:cardiolipin synthase [Brevibacillus ginsengisoli]|uniref:cardiolipin synthase n=1 Tax=Brevibacillus ginsengisoli TaxID=363854 RepID=UPI003CF8D076